MDSYQRFKDYMHSAVKRFRSWDSSLPIRVISNYDSDGISACAILVKALNNENRKYAITILPQLRANIIKELANENYKYYIFCDLGSGQLALLKELMPADRQIIILDHHEIQTMEYPSNIFLVNPHLFDIDGGKEISGAGVTYYFARTLNQKNSSMAHIGVIGAIGDVQEKNGTGFNPLVHEILEDAKAGGLMEVRLGLRMYGAQTRPVHKCLEFCTDPYIPGVSGSESSALQFLQEIGIDPRKGSDWKKMSDLSEEEVKRLAAAIILKRNGEEKPEDIFGYNYILLKEKPDSPLRDAKEFSTLLNSCGRLNKSSLGIGVCLGDEAIKKKALTNLLAYKREIMTSMNWFKDNLDKTIIKGENYVIMNAADKVKPSVIGTITSMIARSGEFPDNTVLVSMAQDLDGTTKVSARIAGIRPAKNIDLKELMVELVEEIGGEAGGHMQAAGCQIPTEKEQEFIEKVKDILGKKSLIA